MFISFFLSPVFYIWFTNSLLFLSRSITHCLHWEWFWARKWRRPKQVYISHYPWCWQGRVDRENITHLSKHDFIHCNCLEEDRSGIKPECTLENLTPSLSSAAEAAWMSTFPYCRECVLKNSFRKQSCFCSLRHGPLHQSSWQGSMGRETDSDTAIHTCAAFLGGDVPKTELVAEIDT